MCFWFKYTCFGVINVVFSFEWTVFHADDGGDARDASDYIVDLREYDVPYYMRVAIDRGINVDESNEP